MVEDLNKLNEIMALLKAKNRKEINKWKEKNLMIEETLYGFRLCKDIDVIYNFSGNEILEYMDYLDEEDPFNNAVKWKSSKKRKEFFNKF